MDQVILKSHLRDFSGDPGVDSSPPLRGVLGSSPGQETKIPHASGATKKKKKTSHLQKLLNKKCNATGWKK